MGARGKAALGGFVALLVLAPAASAADRVATAAGYLPGAPELVGAKVAWQEQRCLSGCVDDALDCGPGTVSYGYAVRLGVPRRSPRTLFQRPLKCASSGPNFFNQAASASVSPTRLAVAERSSKGDEVTGDSVTSSLRAGPLGGPLARLYGCDTGSSGTYGSFEFVLDGDAIAYDSDACGESRRYVVRDLATGQVHPVPQPPLSSLYSPRLAGRYFAYLRSPFTLVVYDWVAGAEAYSFALPPAQYPQSLDVDVNGKVGLLTRSPDESSNTCASERVSWLSPAEPRPHELPGRPCLTAVRIGADRVLFVSASRRRRTLEEVTLAGAKRTIARFGRVSGTRFDSDGERATFSLRTCGGGEAIYLEGLREEAFSAGSERCPAGIVSSRLRSSHGRVKVTLSCPRACTGTLRMRRGRSQLAVPQAFGSERRGRKAIPLKLSRSARALLRRHGAVSVTVTATVADRDGKGRSVRRGARLSG